MIYSNTIQTTCRYDENEKLILHTNYNGIPEDWLTDEDKQAITEYKQQKQTNSLSYFFTNNDHTAIISILILLISIILIIAITKSKDIKKHKNQHKEIPPDWVMEYNRTHPEEQEPIQQPTQPQIVYIEKKQNGCVTFLLILVLLCILAYILPPLIAKGTLLYYLEQIFNY